MTPGSKDLFEAPVLYQLSLTCAIKVPQASIWSDLTLRLVPYGIGLAEPVNVTSSLSCGPFPTNTGAPIKARTR